MIKILESPIEPQAIEKKFLLENLERTILERMANSQAVYEYDSLHQLIFELKLRSHIVKAAKKLYWGGAAFASFDDSKCNARYWDRTEAGGFKLKEDVPPDEAIDDIFKNGAKYAFECATAIVIVYYEAVLHSIGKENFNRLFSHLLLFDWNYDESLRLTWKNEMDDLPGDVQYFNNPEFNPKTPEWQGENVVLLENNRYFAHGIGIKTGKEIILALNKKRKPGATQSAYLIDKTVRPDFKFLAQFDDQQLEHLSTQNRAKTPFIISQIGPTTYIQM